MSAGAMQQPLLDVRDLRVRITRDARVVRAVDGVSFTIDRGEIVGLVGESGCGKSMTALALCGLLPQPGGVFAGGSVNLASSSSTGDAFDVTTARASELQRMRGRRVAMIFQDPMTSLNPFLTLAEQLTEGPMHHLGLSRREATARVESLLVRVGVPEVCARLLGYPHALSGGQRQRVMIAMALASEPDLLVADEPTTALDVTLQVQILDLLRELRDERGLSILLVSHDLSLVGALCDRILVMYAGRIVESGGARDVLDAPAHPYAAALLRSVPRLDGPRRARLEAIEGLPPALDAPALPGCTFAPRCGLVREECLRAEPPLVAMEPVQRAGTREGPVWRAGTREEPVWRAGTREGPVGRAGTREGSGERAARAGRARRCVVSVDEVMAASAVVEMGGDMSTS